VSTDSSGVSSRITCDYLIIGSGVAGLFQGEPQVQTSPALAADGTIYFGSDGGKLYALSADGAKKWEFQTGDKVQCSPAVGRDGSVYVGSNDGHLYALRADGSLAWKFDTGGEVHSAPAIGPDGVLYVGSHSGSLYALHTGSGGLANSAWPMFRRNARHTACLAVSRSASK